MVCVVVNCLISLFIVLCLYIVNTIYGNDTNYIIACHYGHYYGHH